MNGVGVGVGLGGGGDERQQLPSNKLKPIARQIRTRRKTRERFCIKYNTMLSMHINESHVKLL